VPADTAWFGYDHAGRMLWAENDAAIVQRSYHPSGALHTDTLRIRAYGITALRPARLRPAVRLRRFGPHEVAGAPLEPGGRHRAARHLRVRRDHRRAAGGGSRTGLAFGYAYDLLGRLSTESYPGGQNVYTYDLEGRQTGRTGAYTESYTHDARGKVLSATVAQPGTSTGTSTFYNHYSGLGMLVATDWTNVSNSARNIEEMVVDALGHVRWRRKANSETWVAPEHTYVYDEGSSRVMEIGFTYPQVVWDTAAFSPDTTWRSYDPAGNVRAGWENHWRTGDGYRKVHTRSYYGADGRLRAQQGYDERGIFFTGERRGYFSEYRYDALGRRVLVRTRRDDLCKTNESTVDCTSGIERFVWSGDNILWEMRGPGSDSATAQQLEQAIGSGVEYGRVGYTHAGGVDRPLVVWKGTGGAGSDVVVPHLNWRGLFGRGTDASGNPTGVPIEWPGFQTSAYHSMGPTQAETRTWMGSLLEGKRDAGGQMYMRNRYYDPATGQFTQPDPIGIAGGLNVYGFAAGDPVSYTDPYGLRLCTIGGMMRVFELRPDVEGFRWLDLVNSGEYNILSELNDQPAGSAWKPLAAEWIEDDLNAGKPKSDFPTLGTTPVFSQRAVDALLDLLVENGELLPIRVEDGTYFVYNVTRKVHALDEDRSELVRFSTGGVMRIARYEFYPDKVEALTIFKIPQSRAKVFVTEPFVERVYDARLTGFEFTQV
jgi:RHS repeat-associated protein